MEFSYFLLKIVNKVGYVSINRPDKANALNLTAWEELKRIFDYCSEETGIRVVVLSGEGKNFCAGIDLSLLMSMNNNDEKDEAKKRVGIRTFIKKLQSCISSIEECKKPVIAAIKGACIGGAIDLIGACDMRYTCHDAVFSIKEVDLGLVADIGTLQRLPKFMNPSIVAELTYTGRNFSGEEADKYQLVNKSFVNYEELLQYTRNLAEEIASKSPLVIQGIKENLKFIRDHNVQQGLDFVANYNAAFLLSGDIMKAFEGQITKQTPEFDDF